MYNMRESWTDGRLDEFAAHVDKRFDAVDRRFEAVDRRFEAMQREMHAGFEALRKEMHGGFEALHLLMFRVSVAVIIALIGLIATQL